MSKANVVWVDNSKQTIDLMRKLSRQALNASGRVVKKHLKENIPVRTKHFENHVGSWALIEKKTGVPQLRIGFYGWQKVKNRKPPHNLYSHSSPWWIEFGTKPHIIRAKHFTKYGLQIMIDKSKGTKYGYEVNHPGQRATNVLRNTVYNNINEIKTAQEKYLSELNKEIEQITGAVYDDEAEDDD
jgi:hypothetical protein